MKSFQALAIRPMLQYAVAGGIGGYVAGILTGLTDGLGVEQSIGLGGHVLLCGVITGVVGSVVFKLIPGKSIALLVFKVGVLGALFFGSQSLIAPSYAADIPFQQEPIMAFVGGFFAGCFGGFVMWLFRRMSPSA